MIVDAYIAGLGVELLANAPIFRNRSGRPYSKDTLGDDFRVVRAAVFGLAENRTLADFRRSGAIEAAAGGRSRQRWPTPFPHRTLCIGLIFRSR